MRAALFRTGLTLLGVHALLAGCSPLNVGGAATPGWLGSDEQVVVLFKDLHARIYRAYSLGPDRDALHDLLAASFAGRQLTREYVEHYTTLARMQEEKTGIEVIRVDYENVELVERTPDRARIEAEWSVGGLVTHQNHRHARINRYRAMYTLARGEDGVRIVESHSRNAERVGTLMSVGATWPLDRLPTSSSGFLDPLELIRGGYGTGELSSASGTAGTR